MSLTEPHHRVGSAWGKRVLAKRMKSPRGGAGAVSTV